MMTPPAQRLAATCGFLLLTASSLPAQDPLGDLDSYIEKSLAEWGIAGLSIAIVEDDSVVYARGFGVKDVVTREPVTPNTLFAIGSNSKFFTAVAAGILVDAGLMSFDDPATKYLPHFQLHDPYVTREITIRDLMSHRSGLGRRGDRIWYGTGFDRTEVLRRVRYLEPNSSFRSEYGYQNIMFLAAGEAIGAAAGKSWDEVIDERIFTPLGMRYSNTSITAFADAPDVSRPHAWRDGKLVPIEWRNIDNVGPAGSINSSALEMAQWLRMVLNEGTYEGKKVIEPGTLRQITSPHTITGAGGDTLFPSTHFGAYGLGIGMRDYHGVKVLSHTGGIDGMLSSVAFVPERELGVVILTNTDGRNNLYNALTFRVLDAFLATADRDWSALWLQRWEEAAQRADERRREQEAARAKDTSPSHALDAYAGTFRSPIYGDAVVTLEEGKLVLRWGEAVGDLAHWHYNTFQATWRGGGALGEGTSLITFRVDRMGKVASFVTDVQGEFEFTRAEER